MTEAKGWFSNNSQILDRQLPRCWGQSPVGSARWHKKQQPQLYTTAWEVGVGYSECPSFPLPARAKDWSSSVSLGGINRTERREWWSILSLRKHHWPVILHRFYINNKTTINFCYKTKYPFSPRKSHALHSARLVYTVLYLANETTENGDGREDGCESGASP